MIYLMCYYNYLRWRARLFSIKTSQTIFFGQGFFFQIWEPKEDKIKRELSRKRLLSEKKSLRMILTNENQQNDKSS